MELLKKSSQAQRVLAKLEEKKGQWINGQVFLREMLLSQFHARIWDLQNNRDRYNYFGEIEASDFTDEHGFKSYRLVDSTDSPQK